MENAFTIFTNAFFQEKLSIFWDIGNPEFSLFSIIKHHIPGGGGGNINIHAYKINNKIPHEQTTKEKHRTQKKEIV